MSNLLKSVVSFTIFFGAIGASARTYVLKRGDTLAGVARSEYGEPVFGPKGSIRKIYKLNPWAKANPSVVEPGQEVILEEKSLTVQEHVAAVQAVAEKQTPPSAPPLAPAPPPHEAGEAADSDIAHATPIPPDAPPTLPPPPHAAAPPLPPVTPAPHAEPQHAPPNYFAIIPSFSKIKQTATDDATGASYTLESSSAYGVELAWDHWWNPSFSTVMAYNGTQMKSDSASAATGNRVLDSANLHKAEILFLNRFFPHFRFGFGAGYGDHLYLEEITGNPVDPIIVKARFWNPLAMAEWSAYDSESFELVLNLKAAVLPAQLTVGPHGLKNGMEYVAQISFIQKLDAVNVLYGVSHSYDDSSLKGAKEVRTETAARIGLLF